MESASLFEAEASASWASLSISPACLRSCSVRRSASRDREPVLTGGELLLGLAEETCGLAEAVRGLAGGVGVALRAAAALHGFAGLGEAAEGLLDARVGGGLVGGGLLTVASGGALVLRAALRRRGLLLSAGLGSGL